jgi:CBS domain-containing protein
MKPDDLAALPIGELKTEARAFSANDKASVVIGFLKETGSYDALVEEGDRTCIVSIRDLLGLSSLETKVSTIMHQVPRLNLNNTTSDAATLMFEHRARSMPIYQGKKLIGQVTSPSIVSRLFDSTAKIKLSAIMTPQPITIKSSSPVSSARDLMARKKIDQVPVVDEKGLIGIVTSDELVFNLMPRTDRDVKGDWQRGRYAEWVGTYSEKGVTTNEITDSAEDVYETMSKQNSNYSLIMSAGEIQGIITYRDFMRVLTKKSLAPQVPMYIVGLPDDAFEAAMAKQKFVEAVEVLRKNFPDITEARAIIKSGDTKAAKKRSEVRVLILSPRRKFSYSVLSYELADAFDQVHNWAKKTVSEYKPNPRRKPKAREFPE